MSVVSDLLFRRDPMYVATRRLAAAAENLADAKAALERAGFPADQVLRAGLLASSTLDLMGRVVAKSWPGGRRGA